jgi:hypothetical protein
VHAFLTWHPTTGLTLEVVDHHSIIIQPPGCNSFVVRSTASVWLPFVRSVEITEIRARFAHTFLGLLLYDAHHGPIVFRAAPDWVDIAGKARSLRQLIDSRVI